MSRVGVTASISIITLAVYCAWDPFDHSVVSEYRREFEAHKVEFPAWSEVRMVRDVENRLVRGSERRFVGEVQGPESIAFDGLGRGPYTGVADGRVVFWNGRAWADFAYTSSNRSEELCSRKAEIMSYRENEHTCGRPLGLRFHKKTGDLYIADAYFGLMKVGPEGGLATCLTDEAEGVPLTFTNDLDLDDEGNVYFTDSSTRHQRRNFLQVIYSGDNSGRLLKYNSTTKETTVLMKNLQFPNGVSMSKDKSFFLFCEGVIGRLRRYWLKGEKAGTSEVFAILPGFPDNVRTNEKGEFWVAIHTRRSMYTYICGIFPRLRKFLLKLPIPLRVHQIINRSYKQPAIVVKYSSEGELLEILEDSEGQVVRTVSEVEENDGKLWFGSVLMSFIAVHKLE
ncbi:hypothetical protein Sjap_012562 [Stephania japonica]|uniref:Strictosidine synthase conserved region domain-containing protein n=1 Tax=Stephania japonica TaxID=461633 RepID=A0AAP0IWZ8_9MAGN